MKPYVYVIVRKDISLEQQLVQASHAAWEAGLRFDKPKEIASLITLEVNSKEELLEAAERLYQKGISHYLFFEPDFGMGHSALASEPIYEKKHRNIFRKWPLYKVSQGAQHA